MAIAKMKLLSIIGNIDSLDLVIEKCCDGNDFHPDKAISFYSQTNIRFIPLNEENPYTPYLNALRDAAASDIDINTKVDKEFSMEFNEMTSYVTNVSERLTALRTEKHAFESRTEEIDYTISQYEHFLALKLNLDELFKCRYTKVRFGRLPKESLKKLEEYKDNPYLVFFQLSSDQQYVWGVYFCPIESFADIDRIFAGLYFERLRIPDVAGTPEEAKEALQKERAEIAIKLAEINAVIADFRTEEGEKCGKVYSYLERHRRAFELRRYASRYNDYFIFVGWVPSSSEKRIKKKLEEIDGLVLKFEERIEESDFSKLHSPPVKLKNAKLFRPFEMFVEMYGLPGYNEIDPTAFVAITYFLTFGIMFADLGQGIVLSLVGWFVMWKIMKMPIGKILAVCGVSSSVFGVVFGSVFGFETLLNPMWSALGFNFKHGKPIEAMDSTMEIIIMSIGIGVVLLIVAMLMNVYSSLKRKNLASALFGQNGVAGIVFYTSVIVGGVMQFLLHREVFTPTYIVLLIVLPLAVIFFAEPLGKLAGGKKNWKPEKIGEYIVQNIFELFEIILSYVSNTLSFMRIGAFVFAHIGMMSVVTTLAGITEGEPLTVTGVVILVIGNVIVMFLEGLLVAIQSLRLQFYELFSRYFIGDGEAFVPANINSNTVLGGK